MALLDIILEPDPRFARDSGRLRQKCEPVTVIDDELRKLASDMHETMADAEGVGLAAPQVGVLKRMVVIHMPEDYLGEGNDDLHLTLINPEIVKAGGQGMDIEGCLSFPDLWGEVRRYTSVQVRAQNEEGRGLKIRARGALARILQHEIDHLDGILYFDRMDDIQDLRRVTRDDLAEARDAAEEATAISEG
jgi:peptide deformylase